MKQAIILGGSRGIGLAIANKFMLHGVSVTLVAKNGDRLRASVDELQQLAVKNSLDTSAKYNICNLADENDIERCCTQITSAFTQEKKSIDILVNSAGINYDKLLISSKTEEMKNVLGINLLGTMLFTRSIVRQMLRTRQPRQHVGSVISIGSIVGSHGNSGQTCYAASKAGLVGFTKSLSKELESKGITVNLISPGFIWTDMTANSLSEAKISEIQRKVPLQRIGSPAEVANVAYFLANSPAITGQVLAVDGGLGMVF